MSRRTTAQLFAASLLAITGSAGYACADQPSQITAVIYSPAQSHDYNIVPTSFPAADLDSCLRIISTVGRRVSNSFTLGSNVTGECITPLGEVLKSVTVDSSGRLYKGNTQIPVPQLPLPQLP